MDRTSEQSLTDIDEYVTLRLAGDGSVTVEVSSAGCRLPPNELARIVVEIGERLPHPTEDGRRALESSIDAIGQLQQAMVAGGYEPFADMIRRLGIEGPAATLGRSPERDQALAAHLGGVLDHMRGAASPEQPEPTEVFTAEAVTEEGDVGVVTSSERTIAEVRIGPDARARGVEGLGEALTALVSQARNTLREQSTEQLRQDLPEDVVATMDSAPEEGEKAGQTTGRMIDEVVRISASLRRKAGGVRSLGAPHDRNLADTGEIAPIRHRFAVPAPRIAIDTSPRLGRACGRS
ncbi:hypothetical protein [Glycomyces tarimensis]